MPTSSVAHVPLDHNHIPILKSPRVLSRVDFDDLSVAVWRQGDHDGQSIVATATVICKQATVAVNGQMKTVYLAPDDICTRQYESLICTYLSAWADARKEVLSR
jgi:hypothetical protein